MDFMCPLWKRVRRSGVACGYEELGAKYVARSVLLVMNYQFTNHHLRTVDLK
jgi:hypothetical protein